MQHGKDNQIPRLGDSMHSGLLIAVEYGRPAFSLHLPSLRFMITILGCRAKICHIAIAGRDRGDGPTFLGARYAVDQTDLASPSPAHLQSLHLLQTGKLDHSQRSCGSALEKLTLAVSRRGPFRARLTWYSTAPPISTLFPPHQTCAEDVQSFLR